MQRVIHSILTGRILLHLRMAVVQDRREAPSTGTTAVFATRIIPDHWDRDQLSTFVIGVETWFPDNRSFPTNYDDNTEI